MTVVGIAIGIGIEFYGGPRLSSKRDPDSDPSPEGNRRRPQFEIQPDKARRVWKTLEPHTGNNANDN